VSSVAFGDADYRLRARSRTRFAQAPTGRPLRAAASLYACFRALETRISSLSSSGSSMGGLPLPRFGASVMGLFYVRTKCLTSPMEGYILYVQ